MIVNLRNINQPTLNIQQPGKSLSNNSPGRLIFLLALPRGLIQSLKHLVAYAGRFLERQPNQTRASVW